LKDILGATSQPKPGGSDALREAKSGILTILEKRRPPKYLWKSARVRPFVV
jgi:hypothetical protein